MSKGILFVTASGVGNGTIKEVLLNLRDDEFGSGNRFYLVTRRESYNTISAAVEATSPADFTEEHPYSDKMNSWVNTEYKHIEAFMLETRELNKSGSQNLSLFVVLDDEGVKERNLILFQQIFEGNPAELVPRFNKVRIPWEMTYIIWCNLDIANMGFDEYVEEDSEHDDHWWEANDFAKNLENGKNPKA